MQQLLDNPGFIAVLVTLIGGLGSLLGALAVYVNMKTEQARQGERMIGLQRQMDQFPTNGQQGGPVPLPLAPPAPSAPPVATTVLTLPVDGTALHIEAVPRATPPPPPVAPPSAPDAVWSSTSVSYGPPGAPPVGPSVSGPDPTSPDQAGGLP